MFRSYDQEIYAACAIRLFTFHAVYLLYWPRRCAIHIENERISAYFTEYIGLQIMIYDMPFKSLTACFPISYRQMLDNNLS